MRSKRILFAIATQHFKIAGGIGQFYRGFSDFAERLDCYIDLCFDKAPSKSVVDGLDANIIYPSQPLDYSLHRAYFAFQDGINYEMVTNFRNAMSKAFKENLYTHVIANTPEAAIALKMLGLTNVKALTYTHQESFTQDESAFKSNPTFSPAYLYEIRNLKGIELGCQTENIESYAKRFHDQTRVLPFFFPESEAPSDIPDDQSGVLFIGRWEERKNPKMFVDLIKQTGLPAKVLTNKRGSEKFKKALDDIGAEYEIKFDTTGEEKSRFITSAKMAFCPNRAETGPFAVYEAMTRTRTMIPLAARWADNFHGMALYTFGSHDSYKDSDLSERVISIYNETDPYDPPVTYQDLNNTAFSAWQSYLNEELGVKKSIHDYRNAIAKVVMGSPDETFRPGDLIPEHLLNQTSINQITEFFKCTDVNVKFTKTQTLISVSDPKEPVDTVTSLFEF